MKLLTLQEVADLLGTSTSTVKRIVAAGGIPRIPLRDGGHPRFALSDVEAFVREQRGTKSTPQGDDGA